MRGDPSLSDRIEFVVKPYEGGHGVFSSVMTPMGTKPVENFMTSYSRKDLAEAFAAGCRAIESGRKAEPIERIDLRKMMDSFEARLSAGGFFKKG